VSLRGSEATDVDVSLVAAFPTDPQIDLTQSPSMGPSGWLFQNRHPSVDIFVTDNRSAGNGEIRIRADRELGVESASRQWWVRAQAEDTNVILSWVAT
jgi:hypothetical protein